MNNKINNDLAYPIFPPNRKFPIIKSTNLPDVNSNPSAHHNIKISRANFNKTTGMFINFNKKSGNIHEKENLNNKDDFLKQTNDIPKPKRLIPADNNHRIKIRSSESNENIRSIPPPQGMGNTYYHRALIPIGVGSTIDLNSDVNNNNVSKPKNAHNEEHNDSFINELEDILTGVDNQESKYVEINNGNGIHKDENDREDEQQIPDPRINFEQINEVNKSRPQTSYGGLNARRKKLQIALKSAKYRTSNNNNVEK